MSPDQLALIAAATSVMASSGFWAYLSARERSRNAATRLLMGLAYNRIMIVAMAHIEQGWISKDEYEELRKYLYEPYLALGGNGMAERVMTEVSQLPLRHPARYAQIIRRDGAPDD